MVRLMGREIRYSMYFLSPEATMDCTQGLHYMMPCMH